jgi:predicted alpha/beta superfamily hydrolase
LLFFQLMIAQQVSVAIFVKPDALIRDSTTNVFIAGNKPQLGFWSPSTVALEKLNDSLWKFESKFDRGEVLEFKITRGSWDSEAIYEAGIIPGNIITTVTKDTTVVLHPRLWKSQLHKAKPEQAIRGTVKYHRGLVGEGLNYKRDVIVWLPPSYEKNVKKHYPVLYMHDGQNVFDPSTSFAGYDWRVDETADSLIKLKKIEEIIIVGIYNSPDRLPEYSDSPLGNAYMNFVITVVKPLVDSTYRTKPDRKHTAVMGSSMGGVSSLMFVWKRPDIFSMAGCLSSAFWYDEHKTLDEVQNDKGPKKDIRIYLDCGDREKELVGGYQQMVAILKKKRFVKGKNLEYHLEAGADHNEQAWAKRVWRPLVFMFGKR